MPHLVGKKPDERGKIYEGKIMPPEKLQNGKLCKRKNMNGKPGAEKQAAEPFTLSFYILSGISGDR